MKKEIELIQRHKNLHKTIIEDYGGFNRILQAEMDKIEQDFIVQIGMTLYDWKKKNYEKTT